MTVLSARSRELESRDIGPTRMAEVLEALRLDIINTKLAPGSRLRFDELRERYRVGISPLREALMQLAAEGLVVPAQRRGYHVAPISRADLMEVGRLRGEFDALAIAESIRLGTELWEGRVLAAFHALSRRAKIGPDGRIPSEWDAYHERFHAELVSECAMPKLLAFRESLEMHARRYRHFSAQFQEPKRDALSEHEKICNAVINRDTETAGMLIRQHYAETVHIVAAALTR